MIAINQEAYARSDFGVILSCPRSAGWRGLVELGRALQRLQMNNDLRLGLMSSGYASLSGRDLRAAKQFDQIVASDETDGRLSYFAIAGSVSAEQVASTGMKEDAVHMLGPAELLKADLRRSLPHYMVPARVELVTALPLSGSGKIDRAELTRRLQVHRQRRKFVAPRTWLETAVADVWESVLARSGASVADDFFEVGGDSLTAVRMVSELNHKLGTTLPVQAVFEAPTIKDLAAKIATTNKTGPHTRLVPLAHGEGSPVYMWPGLGGYPMNLRELAARIAHGRSVYGIQTHGLNEGETPYRSLHEMVEADCRLIAAHSQGQSAVLVGYSFGARLAAEAACRLEARGITVGSLALIAPGSPSVAGLVDAMLPGAPNFDDAYFRKVLLSAFTGCLPGAELSAELDQVRNLEQFARLLANVQPGLDHRLARRIVNVVMTTYGFRSAPCGDLRPLIPRTRLLTACGDGPSFMDRYADELDVFNARQELAADHYQVLRAPHVDETAMTVVPELVKQG